MKSEEANFRVRISIYLLVCGLIVLWSFQVLGEELTAEQKEVWELVLADWELLKQGDIEGLMAMRHDNAIIWWPNKMFPFGGITIKRELENWMLYEKPVAYKLEPLDIEIYGNVAIVAYEHHWNSNRVSGHAREMQTWIKHNDKWLKIGSLSASCDKLPRCK